MPTAQFILYIATSLDGYIARENGDIDWLPAPESADDGGSYDQFYQSIDALVMGSATYEKVLEFGDWVYAGKPSYVLTCRPLATDHPDIQFIHTDIEGLVEAIEHHGHQRVWVVGGGKLAAALIDRNWIDEYIITLIPIILGSGISLYQSAAELPLNLVTAQTNSAGMVELHYKKSMSPSPARSQDDEFSDSFNH